jgi:hypothetical protein
MRGLRQSVQLLVRCGEAALAPSAAGALVASQPPAAAQAAVALQQEVAALRRWLHSHGQSPFMFQQSLSWQPQQQSCWRSRLAQSQQRLFSSRPRGRQEFYAGVSKRNADQGWYLVSRACVWLAPGDCFMVPLKTWYDAPPALRAWDLPLQLATAVAMVGATYAAVPLYRMFCQVGLETCCTFARYLLAHDNHAR